MSEGHSEACQHAGPCAFGCKKGRDSTKGSDAMKECGATKDTGATRNARGQNAKGDRTATWKEHITQLAVVYVPITRYCSAGLRLSKLVKLRVVNGVAEH